MVVAGPSDARVFTASTLGMVHDEHARAIMKNLEARANRIASLRGWTVGHLREFFPRNGQLLGLNVNRGAEVCIRFRQHGAPHVFLPLEVIIGTLLHELCHCRISPHNHAFWELHRTLVQEEEAWELRVATERSARGADSLGATRSSGVSAAGSGGGGTLKPFSGTGYVLGGGSSSVCGTPSCAAQSNTSRPLRDVVAEATMRRLAALPSSSCGPRRPDCVEPPTEARPSETLLNDEEGGGCSRSVVHHSKRARTTSDGEDVSNQGGWVCPRCSFINHEQLFPVCEICSDDIPLSSLEATTAPPSMTSGVERGESVLVLDSDDGDSSASSDSDVVFFG